MLVTAVAYTIAFQVSVGVFFKLVAGAVFLDFLLFGLVVSTVYWCVDAHDDVASEAMCRFICNRFLLDPSVRTTGQSVEWLYAFDMHCNAFFPVFLVLYVLQFFLIPLLLREGYFVAFLSNTLFGCALSYYHFLTFLGYSGKCSPRLRFVFSFESFLFQVC